MYHCQTAMRWLLISVVASALLLAGCGDGDDTEMVYLHVFNGYAGADSIDVFGPTGTIVTDLEFGERSQEPVAVDRNLGTDFMIIIDGAPETFEIQPNLYSMYPQETGTLAVSQRQDLNVTTKLFRHQQSIADACRLVVDNSLSLLSDGLSNYDFILGWNMGGVEPRAGFDEEYEEGVLDDEDHRPGLYNEIYNNPYFGVVTGDDAEHGQSWVWLGPEGQVDFPRIDFQGGSIVAPRPSLEYVECIEEQEQAEEMIDGADGDVDPAIMETANTDCREPQTYTVTTYEPGNEEVLEAVHYTPLAVGNSGDDCSAEHRVYTDFSNVFGRDDGEEHGEGSRIEHTTEFETSDHYFFVLYGRAVNPLIETWRASDHFTELPGYPGQ